MLATLGPAFIEARVEANVCTVNEARIILLLTNPKNALKPHVEALHQKFYETVLKAIDFNCDVDELYLPSKRQCYHLPYKVWDISGLDGELDKMQHEIHKTYLAVSHLKMHSIRDGHWSDSLTHLISLRNYRDQSHPISARTVLDALLDEDDTKAKDLRSKLIQVGNEWIQTKINLVNQQTMNCRQKQLIHTIHTCKGRKAVIIAEQHLQALHRKIGDFKYIILNPSLLQKSSWKDIFPEDYAECFEQVKEHPEEDTDEEPMENFSLKDPE
jgi:hypothetical protein